MFELNEFCEMDDENLAVLAKEDKRAADVIILRYMNYISFKARSLKSAESDVDDLIQEGLMGLLKAISSFDAERGARFCSFARVCIVNQMKTFLMKSNRFPAMCESIEEISEDSFSQDETPETVYIDKEFFSELKCAVESVLSERERKIFNLYIHGMSYREIAGNYGISEKSVDNAMQRARRKIRTYIKNTNQ